MAEKIRVMIVDDIAETREQLRKLLSFEPAIEVVAMVGSGEEAIDAVSKTLPDVILMDINLPGIDGIKATAKIVEIMPAVQVIMLSVQGETDYMRRAMMAGARDFLTKPPGADELLDAINRAYSQRKRMVTGTLVPMMGGMQPVQQAAPLKHAKVIAVYSPKGGTGCTTLAVNLAVGLQISLGADYKIGLVDTNLQFGDAAVFMKIQPPRTLADLAPHIQDMDTDLLRNILVPHSSGVSLLAAPPTPEDAEVFHDGGVEENGANSTLKAILEFVQGEFDYLILDTAHQVDEMMLAILDISDVLLVVTRPTIPEIRGARLFVGLLQKLEYPMEQVKLVINGVDNKRMGIQPEAIERAMMPALAKLPLDERTALRAANYGEPLILKGGRTPLGQAMLNFAKSVQGLFAEEETVEEEPVSARRSATPRRAGLGRLL